MGKDVQCAQLIYGYKGVVPERCSRNAKVMGIWTNNQDGMRWRLGLCTAHFNRLLDSGELSIKSPKIAPNFPYIATGVFKRVDGDNEIRRPRKVR